MVGPRLTAFSVLFGLGCLASPGLASAKLAPGVHVDPNSPAAKEYVLPLNQARQTGAGASNHRGSALFGAGIKAAAGGAKSSSSSATDPNGPPGSGQEGSTARGSLGSSSGSPSSTPTLALRSAMSRPTPAGNGSLLALLGGGVAILVLGGFGGTIMRRSRRSPSST
jgi:hypothetical protein